MKVMIEDKEYDSAKFNEEQSALLKKLQDNLSVKAPLEYQLQCVSIVHDNLLKRLSETLKEGKKGGKK